MGKIWKVKGSGGVMGRIMGVMNNHVRLRNMRRIIVVMPEEGEGERDWRMLYLHIAIRML